MPLTLEKADNGQQIEKDETQVHIEVNVDANMIDGSKLLKEPDIELMPSYAQIEDNRGATSEDESEPLRGELYSNTKLNGAKNDDGGETTEGDSEDLDDYKPSQKRNRFWDVRCVLMGLLVLLIIIGGSVMAIMAHNEPVGEKSSEDLVLSSYFSDHMVLQRGPKRRALIWGLLGLKGNQTIIVNLTSFNGDTYMVYKKVVSERVWNIALDPIIDTRPFNMTVYLENSEHIRVSITDILFGDVWVCAGSMDIKAINETEVSKDTNQHSDIRYLVIPSQQSNDQFTQFTPKRRSSAVWSTAHHDMLATSLNHHGKLHTLCWSYARKLYNKLRYPIGMIAVTYSHSPIEYWVSHEVRKLCPPRHSTAPHVPSSQNARISYGEVWNAMISPLTYQSIYGFIWHEGRKPDVYYSVGWPLYNCTFVNMVKDWREKFASASECSHCTYPFGFVQLMPNKATSDYGSFAYAFDLPELRWRQTANFGYVPNQQLPMTFMASSIDLLETPHTLEGSFNFYETLAERLVRGAMAEAYGTPNAIHRGPFPLSYMINKNEKVIHLTMNSSIEIRNDTGFEICCASNLNYWCVASAHDPSTRNWIPAPRISHIASTIKLSLKCMHYVVGIRYAWTEAPCAYKQCPVYGKESQLPMPPYIRHGLVDDGTKQMLLETQFEVL